MANLTGTSGQDTIAGTAADDVIYGDPLPTAANDLQTGGILVNGLGGPSGFGANSEYRNDDNSIFAGNIDSVFGGSGLHLNATTVHNLYISTNGYIYFGEGGAISPFNSDLYTSFGPLTATPGGNSTGSDLVWYDFDTV